MTMFQMLNMKWPCSYESEQEVDDYTCFFGGLSRRQVELVILCHTQYPAIAAPVEFLDVNPSVTLVLGFKIGDASMPTHSPWKASPPTLVGSALIMIRINTEGIIRPLDPVEAMQIIGWDQSAWLTAKPYSSTSPMPDAGLVHELASNAFSGFAMFPIVSSLLATAGAQAQIEQRVSTRVLSAHVSCGSTGIAWSLDS
jgi:hypothetical protein